MLGTIREWREKRNLTQVELADRAGVSQKAISNWENGGAVPSLKLARRIAAALGVTTDEIELVDAGRLNEKKEDRNGNVTKTIG